MCISALKQNSKQRIHVGFQNVSNDRAWPCTTFWKANFKSEDPAPCDLTWREGKADASNGCLP